MSFITDTVVLSRRVRVLVPRDEIGNYQIESPLGAIDVIGVEITYTERSVNQKGRVHPWQFKAAQVGGTVDHEGAKAGVSLGVCRHDLAETPEWFRTLVADRAPEAMTTLSVPDTLADADLG